MSPYLPCSLVSPYRRNLPQRGILHKSHCMTKRMGICLCATVGIWETLSDCCRVYAAFCKGDGVTLFRLSYHEKKESPWKQQIRSCRHWGMDVHMYLERSGRIMAILAACT